MLSRPYRNAGFTLIELMIGLAILSILLFVALPEFSGFLVNQTVRSKAESIMSGLQTARSEALRRNAPITFSLVGALPAAGATALAPAVGGPDWVVAQVPGAPTPLTVIDSKSGAEGGAAIVTAGAPAGVPVVSTVVFNPLGGTSNLVGTARFAVTRAGQACVAAGGPVRCLTVSVGVNGRIVMCDPAITLATDSRFCP